jgi:DNA gyrase subunit B
MLGSAEVGTLITALGCGVEGGQNFDIAKLRYHHVIIMTDADVDGAHIRTLLLTFFYRQMPETIRNGYLYIAQPPLYKVKKGKKELYLRDDDALAKYVLDAGVDELVVKPASNGVRVDGVPLRKLVEDLLRWRQLLRRIDRRADARLIEALVRATELDSAALENEDSIKTAMKQIEEEIGRKNADLLPLKWELERDEEHGRFRVVVRTRAGVSTRATLVDFALLDGGDVGQLRTIWRALRAALGQPPFHAVTVDDKGRESEPDAIADADALWDYINARGKKGIHIQRYKGLGEMNAEELWTTTMNPENRVLLQVKIDDAVETEQMFSVLMGDEVEPRREFIETHALEVRNLDI